MGGWGSGNIPDFRREAAAKSGKAPDGRQNGAGERRATSRLAPLPRAGAAFGHTSAEASAAALSRRGRRSRPSHSAASGQELACSNPAISASYWMDRSGARGGGRSGRSQSFRWRRIFSIHAPSSIRLMILSLRSYLKQSRSILGMVTTYWRTGRSPHSKNCSTTRRISGRQKPYSRS